MRSKTAHSLIVCLILTVGYITPAHAASDAELEALGKQIEQLESEEKKQAEAAEKKKVEAAAKRKAEIEAEKRWLIELEQKKIGEEKRKKEEARLAELERQRQEEEAKKRAGEEDAITPSATVIFFREKRFIGSAMTAYITHNNNAIGSVSNGTTFTYSTTPGKQTFHASYMFGDTEGVYEFKPHHTYSILVSISVLGGYGVKLQLVN